MLLRKSYSYLMKRYSYLYSRPPVCRPDANYYCTALKCFGLWVVLLANSVWGQVAHPPRTEKSSVLAHLGTETITQADVDFVLGRIDTRSTPGSTSDIVVSPEPTPLAPALQTQAVELIAQQRRALKTLRATGQAATEAEIDAAIRAAAPADQSPWSLEQITADLCYNHDLDPGKYRDLIDFRLSWPRYLNRHLTEENLRKHFEQQRSRFDGSRFKVDLITLPITLGQSPARDQAEQRLAELRQRLLVTPDHWDQLSDSTDETTQLSMVRDKWVRGWGDMLPQLFTPLLTLAAAEISPPVHTASGVHLVRYTQHDAGTLELSDVRGEVRAHMLLFLLDYLARPNHDRLVMTRE